jgi:hypothetical protein
MSNRFQRTTRRCPSHVDTRRVSAVVGNSVLDHISDSKTVPAAVVSERGLGTDVPAGPVVGRARINDDEPSKEYQDSQRMCQEGTGRTVGIGELCVGRVSEVRLPRTGAVVGGDNHGGISFDRGRLVHQHADICGVTPEVGHLLQCRGQA